MSCEHPIFRLNIKRLNEAFPAYVEDHLAYDDDRILFIVYGRILRYKDGGAMFSKAVRDLLLDHEPFLRDFIDPCPCGRCNYCRIARSKDFANRCMLESRNSLDNYFITLTYDDDHLSFAPFYDLKRNKLTIEPTLNPDDLQKFMKRLRINFQRQFDHVGVRFFACGEYGTLYGRPHYHLLLFNAPLDDLRPFPDHSSEGLRRSPFIEKTWPFGLSAVAPMNWATAAYCARYSMKKLRPKDYKVSQRYYEEHVKPTLDPSRFKDFDKLLPYKVQEFQRQSNRPGLARKYFDERKEVIYQTDEIFVMKNDIVQPTKPPKYFDKLYADLYPERMEDIKIWRKQVAQMANDAKLSETSLTEDEFLLQQSEILADKVSKLVRPLTF